MNGVWIHAFAGITEGTVRVRGVWRISSEELPHDRECGDAGACHAFVGGRHSLCSMMRFHSGFAALSFHAGSQYWTARRP